MSDFTVRILEREFTNPITLPPVNLVPVFYSFAAIGGPKQAEITVETSESRALWEMLEYLRCPIEIYDDRENLVWWGYVATVEISVGAITASVSLDELYNRCAVMYTTEDDQKATTAWDEDADSVAVYGNKEILVTSSLVGSGLAEVVRNAQIETSKKPLPGIEIGNLGELSGKLICKGWWETLDWKYYAQIEDETLIETTEQIADVIDSAGQFLEGLDLKSASGLSSQQYRSGEDSAKFVLEELLNLGNSSGYRMLATVNRNREVVVEAEPELSASEINIFIKSDGSIENEFGDPAYDRKCPVGVWARLKDVIPGSLDFGLLADPTVFFIEEAEFNVSNLRYTPTSKGYKSPFSVGTLITEG